MAKNSEQPNLPGIEAGPQVVAIHPDKKWEVHKDAEGLCTVFVIEEDGSRRQISRPKPEEEVREHLAGTDGWAWK